MRGIGREGTQGTQRKGAALTLAILMKLNQPARAFLDERERRREFEEKHPIFVAVCLWVGALLGIVQLVQFLMSWF
jgi:hypothetical protein